MAAPAEHASKPIIEAASSHQHQPGASPMTWLYGGRMPYETALAWQQRLVSARLLGDAPDTLLVCEHEPVITLGRGWKGPLPAVGTPVIPVSRGGEATYHGPGQIVGYPIVKLGEPGTPPKDLRRYVRDLEAIVIETLAAFQIPAYAREGLTGVWVAGPQGVPLKIASIGVAVRHWVTYHGFALNWRTELNRFSGFAPCGLPSSVMISMAELIGDAGCPAYDDVLGALANAVERVWDRKIITR